MKNKIVYKYIGKVLITFAILLLFPIIVSLVYKERFLSSEEIPREKEDEKLEEKEVIDIREI